MMYRLFLFCFSFQWHRPLEAWPEVPRGSLAYLLTHEQHKSLFKNTIFILPNTQLFFFKLLPHL